MPPNRLLVGRRLWWWAIDALGCQRCNSRFATGATHRTPQKLRLFVRIAKRIARLLWLANGPLCPRLDHRCRNRLRPWFRPRFDPGLARFDGFARFADFGHLTRDISWLPRLAEFPGLPVLSRLAPLSWSASTGIAVGIGLWLALAAAVGIAILVPVLIAVRAEVSVVVVALAARTTIEIAIATLPRLATPFATLGPAVALLIACLIRCGLTTNRLIVETCRLRRLSVLRIEHARLRFVAAYRSDRLLAHFAASVIAVVITEIVAGIKAVTGHGLANACRCGIATALSILLLAISDDYSGIVFGVLQVVFSKNRVARRVGITSKREIFLSNMMRCATDFYIRSV